MEGIHVRHLDQDLCKRGRSEGIWQTEVPCGFQGQKPRQGVLGRSPRKQGRIQEFVKGGGTYRYLPLPSSPLLVSLSFLDPFLPFPLEVWPLNQLEGLGSAVSSTSGVRGGAPAENEYGAL